MVGSIARSTSEKAQYFLQCAALAEVDPRSPRISYTANLEAAIIYGHAIWDHLRAEFARNPKYQAWSQPRYASLSCNALFQFMSGETNRAAGPAGIAMRNLLIHRGGERFTLSAAVSAFVAVSMKVSLSMQVNRAQPWYRRRPNIIWNDLTRPLVVYIRNLRASIAATRAVMPAARSNVDVALTYYFDDPNWSREPATEIVRRYLDLMEHEIDSAENELT